MSYCGCKVRIVSSGYRLGEIEYCDLHARAPEMAAEIERLRALLERVSNDDFDHLVISAETMQMVRDALAQEPQP